MLSPSDYLAAMGITRWIPRQTNMNNPTAAGDDMWKTLCARVAACKACSLHNSRTQTVFGTGNPHAKLLLIGEAPGATEDRLGEPFVGRAGKLLDAMLAAIGYDRSMVYIANILKCRPPNNRDPQPTEVATCTPFLLEQIDLLKPTLIVALGRIAAHFLLKTDTALGKLRGHLHTHPDTQTPLLVTYHPAYLLRSPLEKSKAWLDWQAVRARLETV